MRIILGIFFVLHGLVHMLYFGQSIRLFELSPGLLWPDSSWAFSRIMGNQNTRLLASIACVLLITVDSLIYKLYAFHINGFVLNLVFTPGGISSLLKKTVYTYYPIMVVN